MRQKQELKSELSREAILEAAAALFSAQGYRGTSMRELAEAAGLSTGNVYHHFPDKESVYRTVLDRVLDRLGRSEVPLNRALAAGAFPHDLDALSRAVEETIRSHGRLLNLLYIDAIELQGTHLHRFYESLGAPFRAGHKPRPSRKAVKDLVAPGFDMASAATLACRLLLHHHLEEILCGDPEHRRLDAAIPISAVAGILRRGLLMPPEDEAKTA